MFASLKTSLLGRAFALVVAVGSLAGCECDDCHNDYYEDDYACSGPVRQSRIDTDQRLAVDPGDGVGVFVEYGSGGHWHVYMTCDTARSGLACNYDVVVQPVGPSQIRAALPDDLEPDDSISLRGGDFAQVVARTDFDYDGFFVDTEPGVTLSIDAYLDG